MILVDHSDIHVYLMVDNDIRIILGVIKKCLLDY